MSETGKQVSPRVMKAIEALDRLEQWLASASAALQERPEVDVTWWAAMEKLRQKYQTQVYVVPKCPGGLVIMSFQTEDELVLLFDQLMQGE